MAVLAAAAVVATVARPAAEAAPSRGGSGSTRALHAAALPHGYRMCATNHPSQRLHPKLAGLTGRDGRNKTLIWHRAMELEARVHEMFGSLPDLYVEGGTLLQVREPQDCTCA